jgi:DNA-binding response OmpR family regulator
MKKILIIEDDPIVANVYRNKLAVDGYQTEVATDGETGLQIMETLQPQLIIVDLMLPTLSGVDVIREARSMVAFAKTPIIVLSNTYLTNLVQEAWRAGASKCLSKTDCAPKDVIAAVRQLIGDSGSMPHATATHAAQATEAATAQAAARDAEHQSELRKTFTENMAATLYSLRAAVQALVKAGDEITRLKQVHELYRQVHALNGNASVAGFGLISHMASALEAMLKEIYEKSKNINASTIRTAANAVDFLGFLFERGTVTGQQDIPASNILVVDDEIISRRAITYALDKAKLKSISLDDPLKALELVTTTDFDLIFLDVDMPGMNGFELCTKIRALPQHKKTPVVFVTSLTDFDSRTNSTVAGGNDFIGKPFLFIELTVKSLIHVLRKKLTPPAV